MKKATAVVLSLCILVSLSACKTQKKDQSSEYIDSSGHIVAADPDDSDINIIVEDNEVKTDSSGNIIVAGDSASIDPGATVPVGGNPTPGSVITEPSGSTGTPVTSTDPAQPDEPSSSPEVVLPPIDVNLSAKTVSDGSFAEFNGNSLKILKSGDFTLTGNFYGSVEAELGYNDVVRLRMVGANIINTSGPAIKVLNLVSDEKGGAAAANPDDETSIDGDLGTEYNQPDIIISFIDGTTSTLEVRDYNPTKITGTIYSEASLSIRGRGTGIVKNANQNAIHCIKSVEVKNCTLELSAPAGRGVYTKARYENDENCRVSISARRDAVKCDKFYMNAGILSACSSGNDAIDADDRAVISGGILIADTADITKNYGIKVRRIIENQVRPDKYDVFEITGGYMVAAGGFNTLPDSALTTQCTALLSRTVQPGRTLCVKDSSSAAAIMFEIQSDRPSVLITSPEFALGNEYSVYSGGSVSGSERICVHDNIIVGSSAFHIGGTYSGGNVLTSIRFDRTVLS